VSNRTGRSRKSSEFARDRNLRTHSREVEAYQALGRAQMIFVRFGGSGSLDNLARLPKPKGMRRRTYQRLRLTALEASERSWSEALKRFGRMSDDRLHDLFIAS
jgi:hypothetical protein